MGYRLYISSIPKRKYNKIKNLSREELWKFYNEGKEIDKTDEDWEDDLYIGTYDLGDDLYEFGKYVNFYNKKTCKPFFKNKETHDYYNSDGEVYIVTKEFLEAVIESYKEKVQKYYNDMMTPFFGNSEERPWGTPTNFLNSVESKTVFKEDGIDHEYTFDFAKITPEEQTALWKIIDHVRSFRTEWVQLTPYNLENGNAITTSWKFEYGIFELVRIYKDFDWKKNVMYYHGW